MIGTGCSLRDAAISKGGRRRATELVSLPRIAACTALILDGGGRIVQASLGGCIRLNWIGGALAYTELEPALRIVVVTRRHWPPVNC